MSENNLIAEYFKDEKNQKEFKLQLNQFRYCEAVIVGVQAYIVMKVNSGTEKESCQKIIELDRVMEASIIFGEYDLIAQVDVENLQELEDFLTSDIRSIPSIILTSTMVIARQYKGKNNRTAK